MPPIGYVQKQKDGSYKGELMTAIVRKPLDIRPTGNPAQGRLPEYRVFVDEELEIGTARTEIGQKSHAEYIKVTIAMPEFGPKYITANLGPMPNQPDKDKFVLLWNPEQPEPGR
jgi:uncharacterized protein (DUF736 family)